MISKNLLTVFFLMFSLTLLSYTAYSQQDQKSKRTPEEIATKIADRMKQNLSLSEDQYKQVYSLALTKVNERKNNREYSKNLDKDSRKQMKKQSREEFIKQLKGILNTEQFTKFQENRKKHKSNREKKYNKE